MSKEVIIPYYKIRDGVKILSHECIEHWEKLELFCPSCGKQSVWHDTGAGDYYVGEQYMCADCGASFYLPLGIRKRSGDEQDEQRFSILSDTETEKGKQMKYKDIIGKTIASVTEMKKPQFDDEGWLRLEFTDGTACTIVSSYGGYTGNSEDEYPTFIGITDKLEGLVPVANTGGQP